MVMEDVLLAARAVLEAVLTPNELEHARMDVVTMKGEPVSPSAIISEGLLLRVFVCGEQIGFWLYPDEDTNVFTARLRSEPQDFVAQSGFGWGSFAGNVPQTVLHQPFFLPADFSSPQGGVVPYDTLIPWAVNILLVSQHPSWSSLPWQAVPPARKPEALKSKCAPWRPELKVVLTR